VASGHTDEVVSEDSDVRVFAGVVNDPSPVTRPVIPSRRHPTSRAAGLVDAVGGDGFVSAGAAAASRPLLVPGVRPYTSRTALPTKSSAVRSTNLSVTKRA
jgi:hypothetical protein